MSITGNSEQHRGRALSASASTLNHWEYNLCICTDTTVVPSVSHCVMFIENFTFVKKLNLVFFFNGFEWTLMDA